MPVFLCLHVLEHFRGGGIGVAQPFGEIAVHPTVFFFQLDCQRQNILLAEILESLLGHDCCSLSVRSESIIISGPRHISPRDAEAPARRPICGGTAKPAAEAAHRTSDQVVRRWTMVPR